MKHLRTYEGHDSQYGIGDYVLVNNNRGEKFKVKIIEEKSMKLPGEPGKLWLGLLCDEGNERMVELGIPNSKIERKLTPEEIDIFESVKEHFEMVLDMDKYNL